MTRVKVFEDLIPFWTESVICLPLKESLKDKVISGTLWNGIEKLGTAFFLFVSNLILARLLSPSDFGCVGILMVFISISGTIVDGGFGAALIQKSEVSNRDYSTIFYWNIIVSLVLYVTLCLSSPLIESYYATQSLSFLLRVIGLCLIFNGMSMIQMSIIKKQMQFKKLAKISITATIMGTLVGVITAFMNHGVWSLVYKYLMTSVLSCVLLWHYSNWRPSKCFSIKSLNGLGSYGGFVFLGSIVNSIYNNIISLIIGKSFSPTVLGHFTQSKKLLDVPRQITASVYNVVFPAFSLQQNNIDKLKESVRRTATVLCFINFSITVLLFVIAKPLITVLLNDKWLPTIPFFQMMCIWGLIYTFIELYSVVIRSIGKSRVTFFLDMSRYVIGLILMCVGINDGVYGLVGGYVTANYAGFLLLAIYVRKYLNYHFKEQVSDLLPACIVSFVAGVTSYLLRFWMDDGVLLITMQTLLYLVLIILLADMISLKGFVLTKSLLLERKYIGLS